MANVNPGVLNGWITPEGVHYVNYTHKALHSETAQKHFPGTSGSDGAFAAGWMHVGHWADDEGHHLAGYLHGHDMTSEQLRKLKQLGKDHALDFVHFESDGRSRALRLARETVMPSINPSIFGTQFHARLLHMAQLDPALAPLVARIVRGRGIHEDGTDAFAELGGRLRTHQDKRLSAYGRAYNWQRMSHTTALDEAISEILAKHVRLPSGTSLSHDDLLVRAGADGQREKLAAAIHKHLMAKHLPVSTPQLSNLDHINRSLQRLRDGALDRKSGMNVEEHPWWLGATPVKGAEKRMDVAMKFARESPEKIAENRHNAIAIATIFGVPAAIVSGVGAAGAAMRAINAHRAKVAARESAKRTQQWAYNSDRGRLRHSYDPVSDTAFADLVTNDTGSHHHYHWYPGIGPKDNPLTHRAIRVLTTMKDKNSPQYASLAELVAKHLAERHPQHEVTPAPAKVEGKFE